MRKTVRVLSSSVLAAWVFALAGALGPCGLAFAAAPPAAGDSAPSEAAVHAARELFRQAMSAQDTGDWAGALAKLRRVADVRATPTVLFYIAYNEEKLGQSVIALAHMTEANKGLEATAADKHAAQNADAVKLLPFARTELAQLDAHVPHLHIALSPTPDTSTVFALTVDGAPAAPDTWSHLPVAAGPHRIVVQAPGYQDASQDVTAHENVVANVLVNLIKVVAVAPPPVMATGAQAEVDGAPVHHGRGAAMATTAGAVVLLGGGIASFLVAGHDASSARTTCASATTEAGCTPPRGAIRTFDALALGGWIGAAGLGALSIVLWTRSSGTAPAAANLDLGPGRVTFGGTF